MIRKLSLKSTRKNLDAASVSTTRAPRPEDLQLDMNLVRGMWAESFVFMLRMFEPTAY